MSAENLMRSIICNDELEEFEFDGFKRGEQKGKTMKHVSLDELINSIKKQMGDFESAYLDYLLGKKTLEDLKRCVADIRNVAGCTFLYLQKQSKSNPPLEKLAHLFEDRNSIKRRFSP